MNPLTPITTDGLMHAPLPMDRVTHDTTDGHVPFPTDGMMNWRPFPADVINSRPLASDPQKVKLMEWSTHDP